MRFVEFEWDDDNVAHVQRHGVDPDDIDAILYGRITVRRNKKRSGSHLIQGLGRGGQQISVVVSRTSVSGRWRPITAWKGW